MKNIQSRKEIVLSELNNIVKFAETNNVFEYKKQTNLFSKLARHLSKKRQVENKIKDVLDELNKEFIGLYISFLGEFFIGAKDGYLSNKNCIDEINNKYIEYKNNCTTANEKYFIINEEVECLIRALSDLNLENDEKLELPFEEYNHDGIYPFLLFLAGKQLGCNNRPLYLYEDIEGQKYCFESFKVVLESNTQLVNFILNNSLSEIKQKYINFFQTQQEIKSKKLNILKSKGLKIPYLGNAYWNFYHIQYTIEQNQ